MTTLKALSTSDRWLSHFLKWAPRLIAVTIGSYYGLGIAYEIGLMALIDQVAIRVIKYVGGYVGIGALMPKVQWYAAWAVRFSMGVMAGIFYDRVEKCAKYCWARLSPSSPKQEILL